MWKITSRNIVRQRRKLETKKKEEEKWALMEYIKTKI